MTDALVMVIAVVATGGFCRSFTENELALANELVPYWPASTAEVALMVQVLLS